MTYRQYLAWRIFKSVGLILTFPLYFPVMLVLLVVLWPIVQVFEWCGDWMNDVRRDYANRDDK